MKNALIALCMILPVVGHTQDQTTEDHHLSLYDLRLSLHKWPVGELRTELVLARRDSDLLLTVSLTNNSGRAKYVCPIADRSIYLQAQSSADGEIKSVPAGSRPLRANLRAGQLVRLVPGNTISGRFAVVDFYRVKHNLKEMRVQIDEDCDGVLVSSQSDFVKIP